MSETSLFFTELPDGLLAVDEAGEAAAINPAFCEMVVRPLAALQGVGWQQCLVDCGFDDVARALSETGRAALTFLRGDGTHIAVAMAGRRVDFRGSPHWLLTVRDVTEEVAHRERLLRNEQERRAIAEGLRGILDVLNSNLPLGELLAYILVEAEKLLRARTVAVYRLVDGALVLEAVRGPMSERAASVRPPHAVIEQSVAQSLPAYTPDLLAVPLYVRDEVYGGLALYYPEPRTFTQEDIELAAAFGDQVALAIENARLLAQAEQAAAMAERQRIARELHDAVTQTLFSANIIAEVLPQLWDDNRDGFYERMADLRRLTRGALAEMRTLLLELRPGTLIETPLTSLIRQLVEAITARTRLTVELAVEDSPTVFAADVQTTLYRIAQEALHNVVKHARASVLTVTLHTTPTTVSFSIADNGRGFDPAQVPAGHLGLSIMRERAASIGAELVLHSQPGQGTQIEVRWEEKQS